MPGTTLPRGNVLNAVIFSSTLTPAQVAANTTAEQTFTILGLAVGDFINGNSVSAQTTGILIGSVRVSAPNTVSIQFVNVTATGATPAAGVYGFIWGRAEGPSMPTNVL